MKKRLNQMIFLIPGLFVVMIFSGCRQDSMVGMLVFTQVSGKTDINQKNGDLWRYNIRASISITDPENPEKTMEVLTPDFYSARSPEINPNGSQMIFSGKKAENDTWQIWKMELKNRKFLQVTQGENNCTDPSWLPDGRIVFSKQMNNDSLKSGHALFSISADGCCEKRITFHPEDDFSSSSITDGRVVWLTRNTSSAGIKTLFMVMRPDGTKVELLYQSEPGLYPSGRFCESADGKFYFIETGKDGSGRLSAIRYNNPFNSHEVISSGLEGSIFSAWPMSPEKLVISLRKDIEGQYALYEFDVSGKKITRDLVIIEGVDLIEPVLISSKPHYRILPSEVDETKSTGLVMCMDTDLSSLPVHTNPGSGKAARVRISGINGLIAEVPVEEDGSFYISPMADTPMRFETLDKNGEILRGPSPWIWVRPNERKACVGCHEDRNLAPENRVPLAITKMPVALATEKNTKPVEAH